MTAGGGAEAGGSGGGGTGALGDIRDYSLPGMLFPHKAVKIRAKGRGRLVPDFSILARGLGDEPSPPLAPVPGATRLII